ncbi:hypothetical protein [Metabacillus sp. FJAT-53654]|uniref:Uncharacterized protein n=1 Tax=Metabacillus rhizosphaerae TaxID=3117747 RepID=A0ABZ2MR58_9BACI
MKYTLLTFILYLLLFSLDHQHTYASTVEYPPSPISFQIDMQNWDSIDESLPRKSTFTVIDVESGMSFDVQRRAGSGHADVQPLTKKDTKIMKAIYNGTWSWHRRAVLILAHDSSLIPASMHGMPHGAGALQNGFPGHFCIHFAGSTTHRTGKSDISHHVMILKAAGRIDEYMNNLPSSQLLNVFLVTIKNGDQGLAKKISISKHRNIKRELNKIEKIEAMQWSILQTKETDSSSSLVKEIPVEVKLFIKDRGPVKTNLTFTLVRASPISPWKVNIDPFLSSVK